jgi:hypothetical protein
VGGREAFADAHAAQRLGGLRGGSWRSARRLLNEANLLDGFGHSKLKTAERWSFLHELAIDLALELTLQPRAHLLATADSSSCDRRLIF